MPNRAQEQRCIDLLLPRLGELLGGIWVVTEDSLDERWQVKSPECIASNGQVTAAIEVKRVTGGPSWQRHSEIVGSLHKWLLPPGGGNFLVVPCLGFQLDLTMRWRRYLRSELARASQDLPVAGTSVLKIPRSGRLKSLGRASDGQGHVIPNSPDADGVVRSLSNRVSQIYMLYDDAPERRGWNHHFATEEGRRAFENLAIRTCDDLPSGVAANLSWLEEWELIRYDDRPDGVWFSVGHVWDGNETGRAELQKALSDGGAKFTTSRWADQNVIVIERTGVSFCDAKEASRLMPEMTVDSSVDLVFLVDEDEVTELWRSSSLS